LRPRVGPVTPTLPRPAPGRQPAALPRQIGFSWGQQVREAVAILPWLVPDLKLDLRARVVVVPEHALQDGQAASSA
jgi:hypothetical protein